MTRVDHDFMKTGWLKLFFIEVVKSRLPNHQGFLDGCEAVTSYLPVGVSVLASRCM